MPTFTYGTKTITYTVHHQPSKIDITIAVDWRTGISVVAPANVSSELIELSLKRKASWILGKLSEFQEIKPVSTHHEFISGEKFPYLGRQYRLKVVAQEQVNDVSLTFQNGRFVAMVPQSLAPDVREAHLRAAFRDWYVTHGHIKIQQRIEFFAPRMGVAPLKVVVKDQQARWGSCTKNGTININWRVLMAPMQIVDYVVVHELAHMIHADHSSAFWAIVASVMPNFDERKQWLRVHGPTLQF